MVICFHLIQSSVRVVTEMIAAVTYSLQLAEALVLSVIEPYSAGHRCAWIVHLVDKMLGVVPQGSILSNLIFWLLMAWVFQIDVVF